MTGLPPFTLGPRVPTSGTEIATYDLGGEGPALLFAHAAGFHGRTWIPVARSLQHCFHCWAVDLRGHGASGHAGDGRYDDWQRFVDDTAAVVETLGLADLRGAGHSLGGAVLMLLEEQRPGTFRSLWCYEPVVPPPDSGSMLARTTELIAMAGRRRRVFASRAEAFANYAGKRPFSGFDPAALSAYVDFGFVDQPDGTVALSCSPETEASVYRGAVRHGAFDALERITVPVTLAHGSVSSDISPDMLQAMAGRLAQASIEEFAGLTHFGPMEAPERVAARVEARSGRS